MSTPNINQTSVISSITNMAIPSSSTDLMAYVEMLLVQEYDDQMRTMADDIKTKNVLKKAYREEKIWINSLMNRQQNDGKIKLSPEEKMRLEARKTFKFDQEMNDGLGGIIEYNDKGEKIYAVSNNEYVEATFGKSDKTPIAANEVLEWHGDPHVNDPDSAPEGYHHTDWDFHGNSGDMFGLINDTNFNFNGMVEDLGGSGHTYMTKTEFRIMGPNENSDISFSATGTPTINGEAMALNTEVTLADGKSTAIWDGTNLVVDTPEYKVTVETRNSAVGKYFDGKVETKGYGVASDGNMPSGLFGEKFDADKSVTTGMVETDPYLVGKMIPNSELGKTYDVEVDRIKSVIEEYQMKLDQLNSDTELFQTELSTLTSQRKLAFETVSSLLSKKFEAASAVVRNIK